jgi:hypothetical protein
MGTLLYSSAPAIKMEDRILRHLQAVIVAKLRRRENFAFNWDEEPGVEGDATTPEGGAHGTIWVSDATPLYFRYDGPRQNDLNRAWLNVLMVAANSTFGLRALQEPSRTDATTAETAYA